MLIIEALRQCLEAMKLVDFKDCAESAELWHKFNLAQANAERVLRDGEKQEPVAFEILYAGQRCNAIFSSYTDAHAYKARMDKKFPDELGRTLRPLYTHPAPSLPAVGAVPEGWRERLLQEMAVQEKHYGEVAAAAAAGSQLHKGERDCTEGVIMGVEYCIAALDALAAAPQPAAAPSGDAWQPIETAPKDGTSVLVLIKGFTPTVAKWLAGQWMTADMEADFEDGELEPCDWELHYWQPLPSYPAAITATKE